MIKAILPLLLLGGCATMPNGSEPRAVVQTIASYPHGAFLENLHAAPDGRMLITSYIDRTLLSWDGRVAPTPLARLDVHPVGVLARGRDIIISAHAVSFMAGPSFTATNQMLVLRPDGSVLRRTPVPAALFLNGLVELESDSVLVADALGAKIWRYRPSTGALDTWFADPLLAPDAAKNDQRPGVNGLKIRGGSLYMSNSSRGTIHRLAIASGRPSGALQLVAAPGPVDDFTFLADGSIAAATHGSKLLRIATNGDVTDIMSEACDACTSVALREDRLIVLTTGSLLEGGAAPARVLSVASPASR